MESEESLEYVLWLLDDTIKNDLWYEINNDNAQILKKYIKELQAKEVKLNSYEANKKFESDVKKQKDELLLMRGI